jgi:hypothetical protein
MAELKRRTLLLSNGKQIKLFGESLAISKSMEIGEGGAPNFFSCSGSTIEEFSTSDIENDTDATKNLKKQKQSRVMASVNNPHRLTRDEVLEIADFNIRLWMDLKDNVRANGVSDPRIFNSDPVK